MTKFNKSKEEKKIGHSESKYEKAVIQIELDSKKPSNDNLQQYSPIEVTRKDPKKQKGRKSKKKNKKRIDNELKNLSQIIRENNIFLKNLNQQFKSLEAKLNNLTENPIKIKIIK